MDGIKIKQFRVQTNLKIKWHAQFPSLACPSESVCTCVYVRVHMCVCNVHVCVHVCVCTCACVRTR